MKYEMVRFGDYFELRKGFSYSGQNLAHESDVGFVTLNSFVPGGGYKAKSEKPLVGDIPEKFFLHDGDVCLAMTEQDKGLLASGLVVDYESNDYNSLVYSHHVAKLFPIQSGLDATFVYNVLRIPAFRVRAAYGDAGSTVQDLPYQAMYEQEIPCPPLEVQRAISELIFSIDRKIRVNQQIASTLEQIAQTIFKSWFVDFDPVHAKARGEQPVGMDADTAALFPDSLEDSELGPIPTGWKLGVLGDLVQVVDCLHSKKPILLETGWPYLQLDTITDSGVLATNKAACISEADYIKWTSRIEVKFGDCVITNVGRVGAVSQIPNDFKAAIGRNITALRPNNVDIASSFLIELLLSRFMRREIELRTDSGTILDALNVKNIPSLRTVLPVDRCMEKFENTAGPLRQQMNALQAQNVALAKIRDSLLPRLISGRLEIPAELLEA